jgi:hypothetical protein
MGLTAALDRLRAAHPWPAERPDFRPFRWSLDGGGKQLVVDTARRHGVKTIVEIGVYLGGSALHWLDALSDVTVVGIDPWEFDDTAEYFERNREMYRHVVDLQGMPESEFLAQMRKPDSAYLATLSNLWAYRGRFVPVRGFSPQALIDMNEIGLVPDMIYLDAMKTGDELELVRSMWPRTIITGDDWTWKSDDTSEKYDIREVVIPFAKKHGLRVLDDRATWVLAEGDPG